MLAGGGGGRRFGCCFLNRLQNKFNAQHVNDKFSYYSPAAGPRRNNV